MPDTVAPDQDKKAAGRPRFAEQCYLLWNWPTFHKNNLSQTYDNFTILMGEPSSIINRLMSKVGIGKLFDLKPYEAAALVPKIRIFKKQGDADKELMFRDHTSESSIQNMMKSGFGRGDGIGLKSFDYELKGGSSTGGTALVKGGNTKINFKFLFQNLEMLVKREEGSPALIDLVSMDTNSIKGKDIPVCPEGGGVNISRLWDNKAFRMKVVYGWATPDGNLLSSELKAAIAGSATTLLVNYETHELDFQQDGTVSLAITSNGAADAIMSDPRSDVLWLSLERKTHQDMQKAKVEDANTALNDAKKELEDAKKTQKEEEASGEDVPTTGGFFGLGGSTEKELAVDAMEGDTKQQAKEVDALTKSYKAQVASNKIYVYQRLLDALNTSGRIFYVDLTPLQIHAYEVDVMTTMLARQPEQATPPDQKAPSPSPGDTADVKEKEKELAEAKPAEKEAIEGDTAKGNESTQPQLKPQTANPEDTPVGGNSENVKKAVEASLEGKKELEKVLIDAGKENVAATKTVAPNKRLFYIYYGDLLDVAFGVLNQNPAAANIRAMLGPISFTDAKTNVKTIVNLADVAISLNKFLEWFNKNVVGTLRPSYVLQDFVRDTIKDLIHAALGEDCWDDQGVPKPAPEVTVQPLVVPGTGPGGDEDRIPKGGRINIEDISSVNIQELIPGAENRDTDGIHTYVYIYSYSWSAQELNGDREADEAQGIYHLQIGGDRGLVKSIKFSKTAMPKLDASRATSQACDLRHLQQQYKVTVEMIGNSIFKPGQFVYINPSTMGAGDPQSRALIAERLGLGGYYTVHAVSGDITSAGFRTTIEAIRQHGSKNSDPKTMAPTDGASKAEPPLDAMPPGLTLPGSPTAD